MVRDTPFKIGVKYFGIYIDIVYHCYFDIFLTSTLAVSILFKYLRHSRDMALLTTEVYIIIQ